MGRPTIRTKETEAETGQKVRVRVRDVTKPHLRREMNVIAIVPIGTSTGSGFWPKVVHGTIPPWEKEAGKG